MRERWSVARLLVWAEGAQTFAVTLNGPDRRSVFAFAAGMKEATSVGLYGSRTSVARTSALNWAVKTIFWKKGGPNSSFVECGPKRPPRSQKWPLAADTRYVDTNCGRPGSVTSTRNVRCLTWLAQKLAAAVEVTTRTVR